MSILAKIPEADLLVKAGRTQFEVDSMREAVRFLGAWFFETRERINLTKQLKYYLDQDFLSEEEWAMHLECMWFKKGMFLGQKSLN